MCQKRIYAFDFHLFKKLQSLHSHEAVLFSEDSFEKAKAELLRSREYEIYDPSERLKTEWDNILAIPNPQIFPYDEASSRSMSFNWAYIPWARTFIKIPDENSFITLRTNRNLHKTTTHEIKTLQRKKVGIIGLSVGASIVMPIALERIAGEIRLADFDNLELTNLNRIQGSIRQIGEKKAINTARQVSELDPYLNIRVFPEGINDTNIEKFLLEDGKLDLVVEECDNGAIKLLTRMLCRKHRIPVVMETSDRGLLDLERFDLEPKRPLLHGMLREEDFKIDLTSEESRELLLKTFDLSKVSARGLASLHEIGKTLATWPQLATDVIAGGATAAMAIRMILLNEAVVSGRRYVDIQSIIRRDP